MAKTAEATEAARTPTKWRKGELERTRRGIVSVAKDVEYERLKDDFLVRQKELVTAILEQCQIVHELRQKSRSFLDRLSADTGLPITYLKSLAKTWDVFGDYLEHHRPRKDISATYYTRAAEVVKATAAEVAEEAKKVGVPIKAVEAEKVMTDYAWVMIRDIDPEKTSYLGFAASLSKFFGRDPNLGLFLPQLLNADSYSMERAEKEAQKLHPLIRPLFLEKMRQAIKIAVEQKNGGAPKSPVLALLEGGESEAELLEAAPTVTLQITLGGMERISPTTLKKLQAFLRAQGMKGEITVVGE